MCDRWQWRRRLSASVTSIVRQAFSMSTTNSSLGRELGVTAKFKPSDKTLTCRESSTACDRLMTHLARFSSETAALTGVSVFFFLSKSLSNFFLWRALVPANSFSWTILTCVGMKSNHSGESSHFIQSAVWEKSAGVLSICRWLNEFFQRANDVLSV